MGELSDVELGILRYMFQVGVDAHLTAAEVAPAVAMPLNEVTDRLNELEWVGYVEEHAGADGAPSGFSLTSDGRDAATADDF